MVQLGTNEWCSFVWFESIHVCLCVFGSADCYLQLKVIQLISCMCLFQMTQVMKQAMGSIGLWLLFLLSYFWPSISIRHANRNCQKCWEGMWIRSICASSSPILIFLLLLLTFCVWKTQFYPSGWGKLPWAEMQHTGLCTRRWEDTAIVHKDKNVGWQSKAWFSLVFFTFLK